MECRLRPWKIEDAADLAAAINNKNIQDNLRDGMHLPYREEDARDFIRGMLAADANTTYAFAITLDDRMVGSIGVFRKENIHRYTAEMGYYVAQSYWGRGIGASAVKQMCRYIFENTDILRIFAEPFSYNTASCRILEKNGFLLEGVLRSNAVKNGAVVDMKLYSLLKQDWQGLGV